MHRLMTTEEAGDQPSRCETKKEIEVKNTLHLVDADLNASSDLARHFRARTTVAELVDEFRADMVTAYVTARDADTRLALLAEAAEFSMANPSEPSLVQEMAAAIRGDEFLAVA